MYAVSLDPMAEAEFGAFMASLLPAYAAERAAADGTSYEQAESFAREQHARLLPDGRRTGGHHFLSITRAADRNKAGGLWVHADAASRCAFLYYITIAPAYRRQGLAREALRALQERVRGLGCATLALNVFASNVAATRLYRSLGFSVVSRHMSKAL